MIKPHLLLRKIAITVIGVVLIIVGVLMLVLPGPGLLVIALGLFVLSLEFSWAEKYYQRLKHHAEKVLDKIRKKI